MEKYNAAAVGGWRVLRCTPDQLNTRRTVDMLVAVMNTAMSNAGAKNSKLKTA